MPLTKRLTAVFFKSESGNEPVREWLKSLGRPDSMIVGEDIRTVEIGWPLGMPVCRPLLKGLYEVRSSLPGNKIARVLFCIDNGFMYLLHAFIKKTQSTPQAELDLALKRKRALGV